MKYLDDYSAKYEIWAERPEVQGMPVPAGLPRFKSRKFNSYAEMNAWKGRLLLETIKNGGVRWKR